MGHGRFGSKEDESKRSKRVWEEDFPIPRSGTFFGFLECMLMEEILRHMGCKKPCK